MNPISWGTKCADIGAEGERPNCNRDLFLNALYTSLLVYPERVGM